MSQPFVGEIRCFGFRFAPVNWAFCNGQVLAISQNDALFSILGTTYGGDGISTFALPNLQGAVPMHWGSNTVSGMNTVIGEVQGSSNVTLNAAQMPAHTHAATAQEIASGGVVERTANPGPTTWLSDSAIYGVWNYTPTIDAQFSPRAISSTVGSQPHENRQPFLAVNFCLCLYGVFPPHS